MNISGTVNVLRLLVNPTLCLPHYTVSTFDKLPVPLSGGFASHDGKNKPDIRAVVLDKDNCFAIPKQNDVYSPYKTKFDELRASYPGSRLLIVSNTAGTSSAKGHAEADLLERRTGVTVLRHASKKPGCHAEIMDYFRTAPDADVTSPSHVAIVGDRLFTDVMMANMMGSHAVWVKDGVIEDHGLACITACLCGPTIRLTYQNSCLASRKVLPIFSPAEATWPQTRTATSSERGGFFSLFFCSFFFTPAVLMESAAVAGSQRR